jgi:DNA-binding XRE family transcriptional regulator
MSKSEIKEKFVELRVEGMTLEAIADSLEVSKQTLISLSNEHDIQETIGIANLIKYEGMFRNYEQNRNTKLEYFASLNKKLDDELRSRDSDRFKLKIYFE